MWMRPVEASPVSLPSFHKEDEIPPSKQKNFDLLMDLSLDVTVELGKTKRFIRDILTLQSGSILELDKEVEAPVDILVNQKVVARGEVLVIDDNFGIRITEIIDNAIEPILSEKKEP
jgi:flagellar motor switch protein FliN